MRNNIKKVLLLQPDLADYRVETYNHINEHYDLTVAYTHKDKTKATCNFKKQKLSVKNVGPFIFVKGLKKLTNQYDVVILMSDLHYPQYCWMPAKKRVFKVLTWGIGFRVSYTKPFVTDRKHVFMDKITQFVMSKCDANILYMAKAKEFWEGTSLRTDNMFVAPNTTTVASISFEPALKKIFLFVGTLYKGKGLDLLLKSYAEVVKETKTGTRLVIVGDGTERSMLEAQAKQLGISEKVDFRGAIYDETILAKEFQQALICISPTQGGLSVPKSMGYGVPFIVRKDAITGGEIYHITPDENGIMYEKDGDLKVIMKDAIEHPSKYVEMGRKAKDYYDNAATPYHMAQGAIDAIEYVLKHANT